MTDNACSAENKPAGCGCCGGTVAPAPSGVTGRVFKVSGLDCAEEVRLLKGALGSLVGGEHHLSFDLLNGRMTIDDEAKPLSDREVAAAVKHTGLSARRWTPGETEDDADERHRRLQLCLTILSGLSVVAGLGLHVWLAGGLAEAIRLFGGHDGMAMPLGEIAAYGLAITFGIRYVLPKAWLAARHLRPDINFLMVIAIAGAIAIGEWFEYVAARVMLRSRDWALSLRRSTASTQHNVSARGCS